MYRSETRIVVDSATVLDDTAVSANATEERSNAIRQLLESRTVLQRIIEEFQLRTMDSSILMEDALKNIRNNLDVSKGSSGSFAMAYYAQNPQTAQLITRRLAEILIQTNQTAQRNKAVEKDQFIDQELKQAELDLAAVDEKIKQFKATHLGELPEQSTANMNALNGLHSQLVVLNTTLDRDLDQQKTLEFRIQELRRMGNLTKSISTKAAPDLNVQSATSSNLSLLLAAKRAELSQASARFTPKHPDVVRLTKEVNDIEQQIETSESSKTTAQNAAASQTAQGTDASGNPTPSPMELSTESEIDQARYELDMLSKTLARREKEREGILKNIDQYQNRLNLAPALDQELAALMRDHDASQRAVATLEGRKFNTQMAANATADRKNDVYRILDEASLPEKPMFPTRLHIILIGIGASLAGGFAAALARELLESSLASEEEITAFLKLPVLASIPEISKPVKL
jgi:uncharacterized protein involved in exopolysaccharide biosynthesis